jgi:hypothetical protein
MARPSGRQKSALRASQSRGIPPSDSGHHDENTPPDDPNHGPDPPTDKPKSLRAQIIERDSRIAELEAINSGLEAEVLRLRAELHQLHGTHASLLERHTTISTQNRSLRSLKRKADATHSEELTRKHKRIRRLERERDAKADTLSAPEDILEHKTKELAQLQHSLTSTSALIRLRDTSILALKSTLREKQSLLTTIRNQLYAARKRAERAQTSLKDVKHAYNKLRTWRPTKHGQYTAEARELARHLSRAGCSAGKVKFAVQSCAQAFGIQIRNQQFMGRRTVGRAIDEGGKYGEIQLGREIMNSKGICARSFRSAVLIILRICRKFGRHDC